MSGNNLWLKQWLSTGGIFHTGNIWQCLEIHLVVETEQGKSAFSIQWIEVNEAAKYSRMQSIERYSPDQNDDSTETGKT